MRVDLDGLACQREGQCEPGGRSDAVTERERGANAERREEQEVGEDVPAPNRRRDERNPADSRPMRMVLEVAPGDDDGHDQRHGNHDQGEANSPPRETIHLRPSINRRYHSGRRDCTDEHGSTVSGDNGQPIRRKNCT